MKSKYLIILAILSITLVSYSNAASSAWQARGKKHKISLFSGGQEIRSWVSTGKVSNEINNDRYYFEDSITKKLLCVSGAVVIEVLD